MSDLARAWDQAAAGYDAYFVPRFAPWVTDAVTALPDDLPPGPITVPCCGTFPEAAPLLARYPDREITGVDLSPEMVRLANHRPGAHAVHGDASTLEPDRNAAVVSVFGLQQLPTPDTALASWARSLLPGGTLAVVYWPEHNTPDSPFTVMRHTRAAATDYSWESRLIPALTAAGTTVHRDDLPTHPMTHTSAEEFFDASNLHGSLRAAALTQGPDYITRLKAAFLAASPTGPWTHHPRARLLVARR